jgi:hypothetical protein
MDEQSQLTALEQQEIRSRTARNYTAAAALVMVALLTFSVMLRVLTGQYDSQPTHVDTMAANDQYKVLVLPQADNDAWKLRNDTLFYNQQVIVTADYGCDTKYRRYILRIDGLTPSGFYRVQTDWEHNGTFEYGETRQADEFGRASYDWYCDGGHDGELPDGTYSVLITDNESESAAVTYLPVGYASHGK